MTETAKAILKLRDDYEYTPVSIKDSPNCIVYMWPGNPLLNFEIPKGSTSEEIVTNFKTMLNEKAEILLKTNLPEFDKEKIKNCIVRV